MLRPCCNVLRFRQLVLKCAEGDAGGLEWEAVDRSTTLPQPGAADAALPDPAACVPCPHLRRDYMGSPVHAIGVGSPPWPYGHQD